MQYYLENLTWINRLCGGENIIKNILEEYNVNLWSGLKWHSTGLRKGLCKCYDGRSICITTDLLSSRVTVSCLRTLLVLSLSLSSYLVASALSFLSRPLNSNCQNLVSLRNVWFRLPEFSHNALWSFPSVSAYTVVTIFKVIYFRNIHSAKTRGKEGH
jgi:hypothetical protein